jgi:hypothetical protein
MERLHMKPKKECVGASASCTVDRSSSTCVILESCFDALKSEK